MNDFLSWFMIVCLYIFLNFEVKYIKIFLYTLYILSPVKKFSLQNHKDILNIFKFAFIMNLEFIVS